MARLLLVLCCLLLPALLAPPVQAARPAAGNAQLPAAGGGRDQVVLLEPPPRFFDATEPKDKAEMRRGVAAARARPRRAWSSWSAAPELRSVPGGPDPLHHHASPRRPEQQQAGRTPSSP